MNIEAAVLAFKANCKILLKGGKEAIHNNKALVECWHQALAENNLSKEWIELFTMNRAETQEFLKNPSQKLDLIVPRGSERLINFVKEHAQCAVLVSGRGNNFAYLAEDANWDQAKEVIINAKTNKISGCNALDKILVDEKLDGFEEKLKDLSKALADHQVEILADQETLPYAWNATAIQNDHTWHEEFLALKACIGKAHGLEDAIEKSITTVVGIQALFSRQT